MSNNKKSFSVPFDPTKIRMISKVQSIHSLMARIEHEEIITPSYQRDSVWDDGAKSRLIESLIVKIPIPVFYMDATDDEQWKVVDGLQRITALKEFYLDKTLKLSGLEYIEELEGFNWDQLPRSFQRRIEETDITIILISPGTPEDVKYNIFKRINTGGLPLSEQEIRHALNDGKASPTLAELVKELDFKSTWSKSNVENKRMEFNELVLRAFSVWFLSENTIYELSIDEYLCQGMKAINDTCESSLELKKSNFIHAYKTVENIFGEYAFRKMKADSKKKLAVNKNIYEMWMFSLKEFSYEDRQTLINKKEIVINKFVELLGGTKFGYAVSSRKGDTMKYRNDLLKKQLEEILND
ncbi:DUF262 domain-containing protein [Shewanella sp. SM96]|uniref:DUF262 domain-containing protein n=1 Tax=Shewanella sp. SM96 TaxID=2912813 RepID=UPI0021DAFD12|nr:DUF262 domain-containing protein [Shewanella sp. SM96]MCU8004382.1 DUF262 domain-containing protein [Shewanella sp. SM96]